MIRTKLPFQRVFERTRETSEGWAREEQKRSRSIDAFRETIQLGPCRAPDLCFNGIGRTASGAAVHGARRVLPKTEQLEALRTQYNVSKSGPLRGLGGFVVV